MVAPANRFSNVPNSSADAELATPPMAIAARPAIAICLSRVICPSSVLSPTPANNSHGACLVGIQANFDQARANVSKKQWFDDRESGGKII
jgi:hypothetical protein